MEMSVTKFLGTSGLFLVLVLFLMACGGAQGATLLGVNEGNQARDFTLESLDGSQVSLADYRGQVVLINFWATWCAPCRAEIPDLQEAYEARQSDGFVVLGVNVEESRSAVEPFVTEFDMTYPVLFDETGDILKLYRAIGLPMSLLVDQDGVIRARHVGYLTAGQLEDYLAQVFP
jgi:peroxiredoxin